MSTSSSTTFWGGLHLTTHRDVDHGDPLNSEFQYECFLAASAIFFFRTTIHSSSDRESRLLRYFFSLLLAGLAFNKKSYELIIAVEIFSFVVPRLLPTKYITMHNATTSSRRTEQTLLTLLRIGGSAVASLLASHFIVTGAFHEFILEWLVPSRILQLLLYLFPIRELGRAYDIMHQFAHDNNNSSSSTVGDLDVLARQVHHLLFVTFHIQVGIGYLGIHFLRQEQHRRNQLIRMDVDSNNIDVNETTKTTGGDDDDVKNEDRLRNNGSTSRDNSAISSTGVNGTSDSSNSSSGRIQQSSAPQQQREQEPKQASDGITQNNNHPPQQQPGTTTSLSASSEEQDRDRRRLELRLQKSRRFQSTAAPFIFFTAIPYMTKIIVMGNANQFAMTCFKHDLHRMVRLNRLFNDHESHLVAMATQTATSPGGTLVFFVCDACFRAVDASSRSVAFHLFAAGLRLILSFPLCDFVAFSFTCLLADVIVFACCLA
jgi:hypothetical protein